MNPDDPWTLEHAIEIARIGAGGEGYRAYDGGGGMWAGAHNGMADVQFDDWGLARATAIILTAVIEGRIVPNDAAPDMLAALKTCQCPGGGWNGMPADIDPTIENCMAAGACGCDCGDAIRKATGQTP